MMLNSENLPVPGFFTLPTKRSFDLLMCHVLLCGRYSPDVSSLARKVNVIRLLDFWPCKEMVPGPRGLLHPPE